MNAARETAERFAQLTWQRDADRERSQILLMREFMRRSAWWVKHVVDAHPEIQRSGSGSALWPFGDIAYYLAPSVRAGGDLLDLAERGLRVNSLHSVTKETCYRAIHFGAVKDSGVALPPLLDPYEPLIVMFERGDFFTPRPGGHMDVGTADVRRGKMERYLIDDYFVTVDSAELDAVDAAARKR